MPDAVLPWQALGGDAAAATASFTVTLTMVSDWHIGTGAGIPGSVDRVIVRDDRGLPMVPAKTLTGVWRDACELVALGLDDGAGNGGWCRLVEAVFGDQPALREEATGDPPRPAALSVRPARLPDGLRAALAPGAAAPFRDALTFVKPGVEIDPDSGRARTKSLRMEEVARRGAVLTAPCTLDLPTADPALRNAAAALLIAGAALMERIGGKRRRGHGRCRLEIDRARGFAVADWLETAPDGDVIALLIDGTAAERDPAGAPQGDAGTAGPAGPALADTGAGQDWTAVAVTVRLDTPLSVPSRVAGNVNESMEVVPGTCLLPLLARFGAAHDLGRAIREDAVRITPLTPAVDGRRGLPVPFALHADKAGGALDRPGTAYNLLAEDRPADRQVKPLRDGFVAPGDPGTLPAYGKARKVLHAHNTIDDEAQRPNERVGGLYSVEAIPAGTELRGEVRLRADLLAALPAGWVETLCRELGGRALRLGRSKKDDYGAATIVAAEVLSEPPQQAWSMSEDGRLHVWCLSDVLLRAAHLRPEPTVAALRAALELALGDGIRLEAVEPADRQIAAAVRPRRLETWQVRWGLPRPSLIGLAAGSCAVFEVKGDPPSPERLAAVAAAGLGERRAEGFGMIALNPPLLTGPLPSAVPAQADGAAGGSDEAMPAGTGPVPPADPGHAFARRLEIEAWRTAIHRRARRAADDAGVRQARLGFDGDDGPSPSQIGRLRMVVRRLHGSAEGNGLAGQWLDWADQTTERDRGWNRKALDAIAGLIRPGNGPEGHPVWTVLGLTGEDALPALTEGGPAAARSELWAEAVRAFVEAAAHAHGRATQAADRTPDREE